MTITVCFFKKLKMLPGLLYKPQCDLSVIDSGLTLDIILIKRFEGSGCILIRSCDTLMLRNKGGAVP